MDGQLSFATLDYAGKKKRTKRDAFLAEMAAAVPWSVLEAVIAPHYPKEGPQGGRRAFPGVGEAWSRRFLGNGDARISIRTPKIAHRRVDQLFP